MWRDHYASHGRSSCYLLTALCLIMDDAKSVICGIDPKLVTILENMILWKNTTPEIDAARAEWASMELEGSFYDWAETFPELADAISVRLKERLG